MKPLWSLLTLASLLLLTGCAYTCTSIEAGVAAGRSFNDQDVLAAGATLWNVNLKARFDRERR